MSENTKLAENWWDIGKHPVTGFGNRNRFQNRKRKTEGMFTNWNPKIHENFRK